jgi:hypothetical protein
VDTLSHDQSLDEFNIILRQDPTSTHLFIRVSIDPRPEKYEEVVIDTRGRRME